MIAHLTSKVCLLGRGHWFGHPAQKTLMELQDTKAPRPLPGNIRNCTSGAFCNTGKTTKLMGSQHLLQVNNAPWRKGEAISSVVGVGGGAYGLGRCQHHGDEYSLEMPAAHGETEPKL